MKSWDVQRENIIIRTNGNRVEWYSSSSGRINFSIHLHTVHVGKIWFLLWWLRLGKGRLSSDRSRCHRRWWRWRGRRVWGSVLLLTRWSFWTDGRVEVIAFGTNVFFRKQKKSQSLKYYGAQNKLMNNLRASSHIFSLTSPLWAKHFSQIRAYRELGEEILGSSSPKMESASRSYHCLRWGCANKGEIAVEKKEGELIWYKRERDRRTRELCLQSWIQSFPICTWVVIREMLLLLRGYRQWLTRLKSRLKRSGR